MQSCQSHHFPSCSESHTINAVSHQIDVRVHRLADVIHRFQASGAQLRALLINEGGVDPARLVKVLNYDGSPITARFIQAELGRGMGVVDVNAAGEMAQ